MFGVGVNSTPAETKGIQHMNMIRSFIRAILNFGAPEIKRADTTTSVPPKQRAEPERFRLAPIVTAETFAARLEDADTLDKCIRLYQNTPDNSSEERQVIGKMNKLASSFEDWEAILNGTAPDTELGKRALERLEALAVGFEQWESLHTLASNDNALSPLRLKCLVGMRNLAQTIEEWRRVYELSGTLSLEHVRATEKLCELAKAENAWDDVTDGLSDDDPLHAKALEERLKGVASMADCESLYDDIGEDHPSVPALLEKVKTCTEPLGDWIEIYSNRNELDKFSDTLLEKAMGLAKNPDDYIALMEAAENAHDDDAEKVLTAIRSVKWTKAQWEELRDGAGENNTLENGAFIQLIGFCKTTPEVLEFYLDYVENWDTDDDVVEKMLERLFSVTTLEETKIISILATEDDALREAAEARLPKETETS